MKGPKRPAWMRWTTLGLFVLAGVLLAAGIVLLVLRLVGDASDRAPRPRLQLQLNGGAAWAVDTETIPYSVRNAGRLDVQIEEPPSLEYYDQGSNTWIAVTPAEPVSRTTSRIGAGATQQRDFRLSDYLHARRQGMYRLKSTIGDGATVSVSFQLVDQWASTVPELVIPTQTEVAHMYNAGFFLAVSQPVALSGGSLPLEVRNIQEALCTCQGQLRLYRLQESSGSYTPLPYRNDSGEMEWVDLQLQPFETLTLSIPLSQWDLPQENAFYKIELCDGDTVIDSTTFEIMAG